LDLTAGREPHIIEGRQVIGRRNRDLKSGPDLLKRHSTVPAGNSFWQRANRVRADGVAVQARRRYAQLQTQCAQHRILRGKPAFEEHLANAPPRDALLRDREGQLFVGDRAPLEEDLSKEARRTGRVRVVPARPGWSAEPVRRMDRGCAS
jgi:hypothetical protein